MEPTLLSSQFGRRQQRSGAAQSKRLLWSVLALAATTFAGLSFAIAPPSVDGSFAGNPELATARTLLSARDASRTSCHRARDASRVQLGPRKAWRDRTRAGGKSRAQGGSWNRVGCMKAVITYSVAGENEPSNSVVRRMFNIYEKDYHMMIKKRQQYYWGAQTKRWQMVYFHNVLRNRKRREIAAERKKAWDVWMQLNGRSEGLQEPVIYKGPLVKNDDDDPEAGKAWYQEWKVGGPRIQTWQDFRDRTYSGPAGANEKPRFDKDPTICQPDDVKPGKWDDDSQWSVFKIFKKPLARKPFQLSKKTRTPVEACTGDSRLMSIYNWWQIERKMWHGEHRPFHGHVMYRDDVMPYGEFGGNE